CRHAQLSRVREVLEDPAPARVVARASAVALVDDDQVEVVGRVVPKNAEAVTGVGEGLVEGEVDLAPGLDVALDLPDRVAEDRPELPADRLVDEDVAVGEVENPWLPSRRRPLPRR